MTAAVLRPAQGLAGSLMVLASAVAFSVAGTLTKLISADIWVIVCWRGLVGGVIVLAYVAWRDRGRPVASRFRPGWRGWVVATVGALSSITFIAAFKMTFIANVVLIYATVPFMAAGFAWLLSRERMLKPTAIASTLSLLGVFIVVSGGVGAGHLAGDGIALLMTAGNALYIVLIRAFRDAPMVLAGGISGIQLFLFGWLMGDPLSVQGPDILLLVTFGVAFALALILWTEGARLIPASQSAFIGLAESPIAIMLAWLLLSELPPAQSLIGGTIVLAAVIGHTLWEARSAHR